MDGFPGVTADNWLGVDGDSYNKMSAPWDAMPINQETPKKAYQAVLEHAGCSLPRRDAVDQRIIDEVRQGTASYGNNGIITTPGDVGGWPELKSLPAPQDTDHDSMDDGAEVRGGFNPLDPSSNIILVFLSIGLSALIGLGIIGFTTFFIIKRKRI